MSANHIHVVGTGTIGEPLIGLISHFKDALGVGEVSFSKRTALTTDRSKVVSLIHKGAKLCSSEETFEDFKKLGMTPTYTLDEAFEKADVVIDCTPTGKGIDNKNQFYDKFIASTKGFIAQGSEFGFGTMYARGINDSVLKNVKEPFVHVVSCNTHNIAALVKTIALENDENQLINGDFVCIRRSNDASQDGSFVPAPQVGVHSDPEFGTHHARDAYHLFKTLDLDLSLFSSAMKINTQYMHTIWFNLEVGSDITTEEVIRRLEANPRIAMTEKISANSVFSFGRDHGHFGRILNQTVVIKPSLTVHKKRLVKGFCFTPQDGNALLSSVAAAAFFLDKETYEKRIQALSPLFFNEV